MIDKIKRFYRKNRYEVWSCAIISGIFFTCVIIAEVLT